MSGLLDILGASSSASEGSDGPREAPRQDIAPRLPTYRDRFPRVSTDLAKGLDGIWAMTHADEQKQVWVLFWETDRELTICARQSDWDHEDPADLEYAVRMISGDVPAEGWKVLAQEFLDRFER